MRRQSVLSWKSNARLFLFVFEDAIQESFRLLQVFHERFPFWARTRRPVFVKRFAHSWVGDLEGSESFLILDPFLLGVEGFDDALIRLKGAAPTKLIVQVFVELDRKSTRLNSSHG